MFVSLFCCNYCYPKTKCAAFSSLEEVPNVKYSSSKKLRHSFEYELLVLLSFHIDNIINGGGVTPQVNLLNAPGYINGDMLKFDLSDLVAPSDVDMTTLSRI